MEWTYTSDHPYNFNIALFFMRLAQNQDFVIVSLQKKVWWLSFELWKGQTVFVKAVVTVWNRVYYPTKFSCSLLHFQNWLTVGVVLRFFSFFRSRKKIDHLSGLVLSPNFFPLSFFWCKLLNCFRPLNYILPNKTNMLVKVRDKFSFQLPEQ